MKHSVTTGSPETLRTDCLVVGVFEGRKLSTAAHTLDRAAGGAIAAVLRRGDIEGKVGQSLLLHDLPGSPAPRVLLAGCGAERDIDERRYRDVVTRAAQRLQETGAAHAVNCLPELAVTGRDPRWKIRQAVEAAEDVAYVFDELKTRRKAPARPLKEVVYPVHARGDRAPATRGLHEGEAIAAGVRLARDLGNRPPNVCTPTHLAREAVALARRHRGLKATVIGEAQMRRLGMGALLAVARGSREPPKLIVMEYRGRRDAGHRIALVGKGVTFDSGGISIKPGAAMDEMKFDMAGAASVFGTLAAIAQLRLPVNVVGLVPATENLPDGNAVKPGDIVTSLSGQTIEILNTDAEGRLILCDALTYCARYKPAAIIDIATLTGACVVALGKVTAGLFSNHQPLADALLHAGRESLDRAWQMPLWDDYQRGLDSNFADMANVGGREGGAITAACFLSRYVGRQHWAHLDIAGVAWRTGKDKGATGRPVPLLVQYLLDQAAA